MENVNPANPYAPGISTKYGWEVGKANVSKSKLSGTPAIVAPMSIGRLSGYEVNVLRRNMTGDITHLPFI